MTEHTKTVTIALVALAVLIFPSSAECDCHGGDFCWDCFSSLDEARDCYEYCKSPVAFDSTVTIAENTLAEISLLATDPDGDPVTCSISTLPSNGTLVIITGNSVVYSPRENFTGVDSFSFTAHDKTHDSNTATVTITVGHDTSCRSWQAFFGNVTIGSNPAPEVTTILVAGPGISSNTSANPVVTRADGSYGSANVTSDRLLVQGCVGNGTPLIFYADGQRAEVREIATSGQWQSAFPFRSGETTNLDIRVPPAPPLPDEVSIDALSMTISNSTFRFTTDLKLEGDPWMEARVTPGMFTVRISATGVHKFSFLPELRRDATLGIYENGRPVSEEKNVWFGWDVVTYEYVAHDTRTFDILISVDEQPGIHDVKHITIHTTPPVRSLHTWHGEGSPGGFIQQIPSS